MRAFLVLLGLCLVASPALSDPPADRYADGRALISDIDRIVTPNGIQETFEATLGGARQVVSVRGADRTNPIILFIHGGPGAVEIPIAWTFQRPWEDYFTVVQYDQRGAGKSYRLNDPEKLNALTFQVYGDLEKIFAELADDNNTKVVVLTGTGKGFCSGGSVNDIIGPLLKMKGDELYKFTRMTCNVVKNMRQLKKPIIAAVNGIAAGAGAMLMLASDLRIFSDKARAAFLFVKVGLSGADMGALYLLPRIVGLGKATELVYFGDTIDAAEAHRIGLANRVVPSETLMDETYKWAARLKDGPLYALGVTKELLEYEGNVNLETALEMEAAAQARCMETPDFIEGYNAFIEKRPLKFNRG